MSKTWSLELRDSLKDTIKQFSGYETYHKKAPVTSVFPYIVFDVERLGSDAVSQHIMTVDLWDEGEEYSRLDSIADRLEHILDREMISGETFFATIYLDGSRQKLEDPDKSVKRVQVQFEIRLTERKSL